MSTDQHPHVQPLLADFVLGELSEADRRRVAEHVATCSTCATELQELAQTFNAIGFAEEAVPPPPGLRARVLENLRVQESAADLPASVTSRRRAFSKNPWLALAATIAIGLAGALYLSVRRHADLSERLQRSETVSSDLREALATNAAQADLAVAILTAPDMNRIDLAGYDASRDAVARAYWSAARGLLIVADRLPDPPPGRVYQVWLIGSGAPAPVSAGVLESPRNGRGMLIVPAPAAVTGKVTVAVTDEPPGGRSAPSGGKHLAGS